MQKNEIEELFERYKRGECTGQERAVVERWYLNWNPETFDLSEQELRSDLEQVKRKLPKKGRHTFFYYSFAAAAILLLTIGAAFFFRSNRNPLKSGEQKIAGQNTILPGSNKAMLTLANGKTIILDTMATGKVTSESGIRITKTTKGQLVYQVESPENPQALIYNTISTPKGGQYQVLLQDGTRIWLNAASQLRFPTAFTGRERKVELSGEAYFEVAKNKAMPFKVKTLTQEIEVLGTHFNVNAYADEDFTKTTLLEGKVKVIKGGKQAYLIPGQQAVNRTNSLSLKVNTVNDIAEAVAWKNGLFMFDNEDVHTIMNKIARWYNIDVEYAGDPEGKTYGGNISRFTDVREVLKTMELTGTIHFKIEGRRIIVMP